MGLSRQEYWSGLPLPSPGHLPNLGIESESVELRADSLPSEPRGIPSKFKEWLNAVHSWIVQTEPPARTQGEMLT